MLMLLLAVLVICRLETTQSHANSRQAGSSCIECLGAASSLVCQSCSNIAVEGGKKRDNGQVTGP